MDGRLCSFLALAMSLGLCGCIPGQSKLVSSDVKSPTDAADMPEPKASMNPFGPTVKREPKLELAFARMREDRAAGLKDSPEQQFRELDEARRMYQEILNYDKQNLEGYCGLGRIYMMQRNYDKAAETFQKALEQHPKSAVIYAEWAAIHSKQNDFGNAIAKLNKAREIDPENQDYMMRLGITLISSGQVERGVDMMARARGRAAANLYTARFFERKNQPNEARRYAQMALEANPNFNDARSFLTELDQRNRPANQTPPATLQLISNDESR